MSNNDGLDTRLQQLYQQIPKEQPSQAVDSAILQAAQQSIANKTYWRPVWGIAASVVMMSSMVWYWQAQQPQELARAVAVSAPPPQAKPVPQQSFEDNAKDENAVMAEDEFGSLHDQVVEEKVTVNKPAERQLLLQAKSKQESVQTEELRQLPAAAPVISLENRQAEADALVAEPQAEQAKQARVMASPAITDNLSAKREKKAEGLSAKLNQTQDKNINNQRTPEQVRAVFEKNFAQFNTIYQQALKDNPSLGEGKVHFSLIVATNGEVVECKITFSTLNNSELESKIIELAKLLRFGQAEHVWQGEYIMSFYKSQIAPH